MALSKIIIEKQPGEKRIVSMDFSNKMATAEVISTVTSISQFLASDNSVTTDLTFTATAISGQVVQFLVAGGQIPTRTDITYCDYKVTVTVVTSLSQILENDGILRIKED